jgi:hypothetical protein
MIILNSLLLRLLVFFFFGSSSLVKAVQCCTFLLVGAYTKFAPLVMLCYETTDVVSCLYRTTLPVHVYQETKNKEQKLNVLSVTPPRMTGGGQILLTSTILGHI